MGPPAVDYSYKCRDVPLPLRRIETRLVYLVPDHIYNYAGRIARPRHLAARD